RPALGDRQPAGKHHQWEHHAEHPDEDGDAIFDREMPGRAILRNELSSQSHVRIFSVKIRLMMSSTAGSSMVTSSIGNALNSSAATADVRSRGTTSVASSVSLESTSPKRSSSPAWIGRLATICTRL